LLVPTCYHDWRKGKNDKKAPALDIRGASKIKLKKVNKKRMVTIRRVIIFFEYLKAFIADLITLLSSSIQNS
jgi:hypothetical protein